VKERYDTLVGWLCQRFVDRFGTPTAFTITTIACVAWLLLMIPLGVARWNTSAGLAGNTVESTLELFLEIAILFVAARTDRRTAEQRVREMDQIDRIERLEQAVLDKLSQ